MPDDSSLLLETRQRIEVFAPPMRSADDLEIRGKLCGRGLAAKGLDIGFCALPTVQADAPWVSFTINGANGMAQVNWGSLRRFVDLPVEGLLPEDIALIVEEKAAGWLEEIEEKSGLAIRLVGVSEGGIEGDFLIGLMCGAHSFPMALSRGAGEVLSKGLPYRYAQVPDSLTVALRLEIGSYQITTGELGALRAGDALASENGADHLRLIAQDTHSAAATWVETGLEMTSAFGRNTLGEHFGMASELDDIKADAMDDLDVRISVRAGEALMTLGDLKKLGPGSILPMAQPESDSVDLVVNGRRIGSGQMVTVGGTRAVEIKELFGDG